MKRAALSIVPLACLLAACAILRPCGGRDCAEDAALSSAVRAALARDPALGPPNEITVQTRDHIVYLAGLVDTPFERALAESLAARVQGVKQVIDSLGLSGGAR